MFSDRNKSSSPVFGPFQPRRAFEREPVPGYDATGRFIRVDESSSPAQKNPNPELESALDAAKRSVKSFDESGYKLSSKFLRHYMEGSGKPVRIESGDLENSHAYREGMEYNNRRFEDSITKGYVDGDARNPDKKSRFKDQILQLRDGETIDLDNPDVQGAGDAWDRDISRNYSILRNPDAGFAMGAVKLKSLGNLQATRNGNRVDIEGSVYHTLVDKYDFNNDTYIDKKLLKKYRTLNEQGDAKPFTVYGSKSQRVRGALEIRDGKIRDSKFQWENAD